MSGPGRRAAVALSFILALTLLPPTAVAATSDAAPTGIPGVTAEHLSPDFWIGRLRHPHRVAMDDRDIERRNARLQEEDPSLHDLAALPDALVRQQVAAWLARVSRRPTAALFDADGRAIDGASLDALMANAAAATIPLRQRTRYGLSVERASLRTFPTTRRVFSRPGDLDLDRFQESALMPATPVVIAHESRDHDWWFVVTPTYAAWVPKTAIAEGPRSVVLAYASQRPARVVTGAVVRTTLTRDEPRVSERRVDMGVRLPMADVPAGDPVNGQHPGASWVVSWPVRDDRGALALQPALIPRSADTAARPLPLTAANVVRQSFKFLGERYGWGDADGTRDCSGFVSAVFASMGVVLPRNTGDQARNPAFMRRHFDPAMRRDAREASLRSLRAGDLVYVPGHVMLVLGAIDGVPYVIHDILDGKVLDAAGNLRSLHLNGVVVTALPYLRLDAGHDFIDGITDVVSMLDPQSPPKDPTP